MEVNLTTHLTPSLHHMKQCLTLMLSVATHQMASPSMVLNALFLPCLTCLFSGATSDNLRFKLTMEYCPSEFVAAKHFTKLQLHSL